MYMARPARLELATSLLRRYAAQNSSVSNWTEVGLKQVG
jgi:hypothetical protein